MFPFNRAKKLFLYSDFFHRNITMVFKALGGQKTVGHSQVHEILRV